MDGLPLVAASGVYPLVEEHGLEGAQLSCWWHRGSAAHVTSSWTRGQTSVPCIARQILSHWTTREALKACLRVETISH